MSMPPLGLVQMPPETVAAAVARTRKTRAMWEDPDLTGELLFAGLAIVQAVESGLGTDQIGRALGWPDGTQYAVRLERLLASDRPRLTGDGRIVGGVLARHLPAADWPKVYRKVYREWQPPVACPTRTAVPATAAERDRCVGMRRPDGRPLLRLLGGGVA